ncbi:Polynucleotide 5'-hydroxyl-kinase grc3 [Coniosporium tulheliwenetii]|uniref:Polynucleotide 5'-hydroxyl-kinase grc3 n=1 Tax=Coniosporium tulheliwenetii TaxID=3383036 RepID=A0ACC2ZIB6_9PEZI|nr:Polynucleotide 5'-hydroxyl-kinase grc3 [Cladosporium sp. JES 115]
MVSDDGFKRQLFPLEIPWKWHQAITAPALMLGDKPPRVMVCGPKGTGKSTLARLMVNRLLTAGPSPNGLIDSVFLLDLDPGQPEYSPPGQVSLLLLQQPNFGPPFSHPITDVTRPVRTIRAHALGSTSPKEDPDHFLRCAFNLMNYFDIILPRSPLVINTPGWVVGTGGDILVQLIKNLDVSEICYTKDDEKPQILQALTQAAGNKPIRILPSQQTCAVAPRSAAELRDMQMLSYFHQAGVRTGHLHWDASPLTHKKPYIVGYGERNSAILGVMCYGDWPGAEYLSTLLDGSLVSIAVIEDVEEAGNYPDDASPPPPVQLTVSRAESSDIPYIPPGAAGFVEPLNPLTSHTIGQALIRGIDLGNKAFHILTPVPAVTLASLDPVKTVLIKGTDAAPGWAYMEEVAWRNAREGGLGAGGDIGGSTEKQPWLQEIGPGGRGREQHRCGRGGLEG